MLKFKQMAVFLLGLILVSYPLMSYGNPEKDLAAEFDEMLTKAYPADEPGAAVLVIKDGKPVLRKAYGMADLELGVKLEPDMVFRIGSVTKQFTAVAILMLSEQGKLSLQDDLTKFLPDYPAQGRRITVQHLLTHTSGIKSYTSMPEWAPLQRKDMTLQELIDLFKNQPMEFNPDEQWNYNNSGYVLLGAVIEKASGLSYEGFLQKHIFEPLGMKHSHYGNAPRITPRRVPGYQKVEKGYENAPYLSMTQPYAAGSLLSSVDDLALWNEALFSGKLVKKETLELAFQPYKLKNGTSTGYGYGWFISEYGGHRMIEHGGGIHGFLAYFLTIPDERIFVAILHNSIDRDKSPEPFAFKIAAMALGKPYQEPVPAKVDPKSFEPLVGVYENERKEESYLKKEGTQIFLQSAGGGKNEILPLSETEFFAKNSTQTRIRFIKDAAGKVIEMRQKGRIGPMMTLKRTDKPLPQEKKQITLDPALYDQYVGEYEVMPGFIMTISKEDNRLMSQATGQGKVEIFPESETRFFPKEIDAVIEFVKDESGKVTSAILHQGGQKITAKKIK